MKDFEIVSRTTSKYNRGQAIRLHPGRRLLKLKFAKKAKNHGFFLNHILNPILNPILNHILNPILNHILNPLLNPILNHILNPQI